MSTVLCCILCKWMMIIYLASYTYMKKCRICFLCSFFSLHSYHLSCVRCLMMTNTSLWWRWSTFISLNSINIRNIGNFCSYFPSRFLSFTLIHVTFYRSIVWYGRCAKSSTPSSSRRRKRSEQKPHTFCVNELRWKVLEKKCCADDAKSPTMYCFSIVKRQQQQWQQNCGRCIRMRVFLSFRSLLLREHAEIIIYK